MNNEPLVSCIINFLNTEKFLEEAIESVFSQSYKNWELLLVDDGSTDNSTWIARNYAEHHPEKVRYLEHEGHENRGASAARNLGILHAKGEYIAFLDADDIWLQQKLEQQVAILEKQSDAAMVYSSTYVWYSWTNKPEDAKRDSERGLGEFPYNTLVQPPTLLTHLLQRKTHTPAPCSVLMRRRLIDDVGGFDESFNNLYEDQAFFVKVFLNAKVFLQSGSWDRYRQHPESLCSVGKKSGQYHPFKPHPARLTFLNWLEEYLEDQGVKDREIWKALRENLFPYYHPRLHFLLKVYRLIINRLESFAIHIGRRILPMSIRRWLWVKWENHQYRSPNIRN